jgi:dipeptidyl aminopeptidase/acylaminoacyl peptidase
MLRTVLLIVTAAVAATLSSGAQPQPTKDSFTEWVTTLYRPSPIDQVVLAPDGRHVAYGIADEESLAIYLLNLDDPAQKVKVDVETKQTMPYGGIYRPRLRFIEWATSDRLVFAPMPHYSLNGGGAEYAPIYGINPDGSAVAKLADSELFSMQEMRFDALPPRIVEDAEQEMRDNTPTFKLRSRRSRLVGVLPSDPTKLIVEAIGDQEWRKGSSVGGNLGVSYATSRQPLPSDVYSIDVRTGKSKVIGEEDTLGDCLYDQQGKMQLLWLSSRFSPIRSFQYNDRGTWRDFGIGWPGMSPDLFTLTSENYFGQHAYPLGIGFDPRQIYVATNVGRDTFAVEAFDLKTHQRRTIAEDPRFDLAPDAPDVRVNRTLVFDRHTHELSGVRGPGTLPHTHWIDPEIGSVQKLLDDKLAPAEVQVLQWNDDRTRFLITATDGTNLGSYYIFDRRTRQLSEFLSKAAWLRGHQLHASSPFEFTTPAGWRLSGYITLPRTSLINPPPLALMFPSAIANEGAVPFDREAQILAEMGLIVIRLNTRGTAGFGAKFRDAILEGIDRVPLEDAVATLEWAAARYKFDRRRVVACGSHFGGLLALRALQLKPDLFRCALAINPEAEPEFCFAPWSTADGSVDFEGEVRYAFLKRQRGTPLAELSILRHVELLTKPVFLMAEVSPRRASRSVIVGRELKSKLGHGEHEFEYVEASLEEDQQYEQRAKAYRQLQEFFNYNLYDYKVQIGETKVRE